MTDEITAAAQSAPADKEPVAATGIIAKTSDDRAEKVRALVDRFMTEQLRGSPVARDTEVWNTVYHAKEALKDALVAFLKEK